MARGTDRIARLPGIKVITPSFGSFGQRPFIRPSPICERCHDRSPIAKGATPLPSIARRFRTVAIAAVAAAPVLTGVLTGLGPAPGVASSHREAPLTAADPQIDSTDLYAFVSPDKPDTVTLIANWIPFEEPAGGPNFYWFAPDVRYDINVDNDGDAKPDVIFRWVFTNHYRNK